jgi:hypothetical protein
VLNGEDDSTPWLTRQKVLHLPLAERMCISPIPMKVKELAARLGRRLARRIERTNAKVRLLTAMPRFNHTSIDFTFFNKMFGFLPNPSSEDAS